MLAALPHELPQHLIAPEVPMPVVDGLEVVHVDDGHGEQGRFGGAGVVNLLLQRLHEIAPVVQPGKGVMVHGVVEIGPGAFKLQHQPQGEVSHDRRDHQWGGDGDDPC